VATLISPLLRSTFETVTTETPTSRAMSCMVTAMVVKDIIYGRRVSARKVNIGAVRMLSGGPCQNNFRGCDGLAYMTLGMIGDMYQQPRNRRGQLLPSHHPDLLE
jgi:hypothetical protein